MTRVKNPIPPVSSRQVTQDSTLPFLNKELIPVIRAFKDAADAAPRIATTSMLSDGAGTYLTLWSEIIPTNRTWFVTAEVVGRVAGHFAAYQLSALFENTDGTAAQVDTTTAVVAIESDAACDAKFDLTGTTLSVQVRDEATTAMSWRAIVQVFPSEE